MRVAIVDDEKEFLYLVHEKLMMLKEYKFDVSTYTNVDELDNKEVYDFILLDIEMPGMDGIEYAKKNRNQKIIFLTSQIKRVKEAFGSNVYGFIEKDDINHHFIDVLRGILLQMAEKREVYIKTDQGIIRFIANDIQYLQYLGSKEVVIYYNNKMFLAKGKSLQVFIEKLDDQFIYIDRSTIVNVEKIMGLVNDEIIIAGLKNIFKVSARRLKTVKEVLREKGI